MCFADWSSDGWVIVVVRILQISALFFFFAGLDVIPKTSAIAMVDSIVLHRAIYTNKSLVKIITRRT